MERKNISLSLSVDIIEYLNNLSKRKGMNRTAIITMLLNEYKESEKKEL